MAQKPHRGSLTADGAHRAHPSKAAGLESQSERTKEKGWSTLPTSLAYFKPLIPLLSLEIRRTEDWRNGKKN